MTPSRMSAWKKTLLTYPCPTCFAAPGERCLSASGKVKSEPHADRGRLGLRCRKCGHKLPIDAEVDDLCGHCELLRELLLERYQPRRRRL